MEKNRQEKDFRRITPQSGTFVPTELGSAHFVARDSLSEGSSYKDETDPNPTAYKQGVSGPPWGIIPSMQFVCDEVGIDYQQFISSLAANKQDSEIAGEFGVSENTIKILRERFYSVEATNGNYGQD